MNSDYVTALRIEQHQADLVRLARHDRMERNRGRRRFSRRLAPAALTLPWRRPKVPAGCRPEVAGA